MKKLPLFLSILLIFTLCACGTPAHPAEAATASTEATTLPPPIEPEPVVIQPEEPPQILSNIIETKYYTITLPEEWVNSCEYAVIDEATVVLYEAQSYAEFEGGKLCTIQLIPTSEDWMDFPNYTINGILKTPDGDYQVLILYPTDVQFTEETADAYNTMNGQLMDVLYTLSPKDGIEMAMP